MVKGKGALKNKARLGHRALGSVNKQDNTVDHLEDTLHLAAKVGVTGGINDVDLGVLVIDGGVFCKNGDAALSFDIVRVHHAVNRFLIFAVDTALTEHFVHKRGLAVVNVGDNGNIA